MDPWQCTDDLDRLDKLLDELAGEPWLTECLSWGASSPAVAPPDLTPSSDQVTDPQSAPAPSVRLSRDDSATSGTAALPRRDPDPDEVQERP